MGGSADLDAPLLKVNRHSVEAGIAKEGKRVHGPKRMVEPLESILQKRTASPHSPRVVRKPRAV
jgi:hypothetical protein